MNALQVAEQYFEYSNESDFSKIETLLTASSTYSSQNTGLYLGAKDIITMQRGFHESFVSLHWDVIDMKEEKPGIVRVDFDFNGIKNGENIEFSAIEYIVVLDYKIQHIEIRNK